MFVNPKLDEIFLVSGKTRMIHAASRLSDACGISGDENGSFGLVPSGADEREAMLTQFIEEYADLTLCPHCFADDLAERARRESKARAWAKVAEQQARQKDEETSASEQAEEK